MAIWHLFDGSLSIGVRSSFRSLTRQIQGIDVRQSSSSSRYLLDLSRIVTIVTSEKGVIGEKGGRSRGKTKEQILQVRGSRPMADKKSGYART